MTQSKSTKRALLASALSILVCVALLVGTTFAWFTDSVTNKGNRIEAGSLKVDLLMDKGKNGNYESIANGTGDIFSAETGNGILWEPGKTEIVYLAVQNKGSLAINYNLLFDITDGDPGLIGSLEYAVLDGKQAADVTAKSWEELKAIDGAQVGELQAGETTAAPNGTLDEIVRGEENETDYFALAVHMKENAGNEYQNGSITIDLTLVAKQAMAEEDGFGSNEYDKDASYPVSVDVEDLDSLEDALNNTGAPVEINVTQSITDGKSLTVTGDVTMNLGNNTLNLHGMTVVGAGIKVENGGSMTINAEANKGLVYTAGSLTTDGNGSTLTVNGGNYGVSGSKSAQVTAQNGSNIYLNDGIFSNSGYQGHAVMATSGSTVTISGGSFSVSGAESTALYADGGTIVVDNCKFSYINGKRYAVANGGQILVSKTVSPSQPTSVAAGCIVNDNGDGYWLISEN